MSTTPEEIAQGQWVIDRYAHAKAAYDTFEWPRLEVAVISDATYAEDVNTILVCPWCHAKLHPGGSLHAVDIAERWTYIEEDSDLEDGEIALDGDVDADFGDTLHFAHDGCDKPVRLPDGWTERWL